MSETEIVEAPMTLEEIAAMSKDLDALCGEFLLRHPRANLMYERHNDAGSIEITFTRINGG